MKQDLLTPGDWYDLPGMVAKNRKKKRLDPKKSRQLAVAAAFAVKEKSNKGGK